MRLDFPSLFEWILNFPQDLHFMRGLRNELKCEKYRFFLSNALALVFEGKECVRVHVCVCMCEHAREGFHVNEPQGCRFCTRSN